MHKQFLLKNLKGRDHSENPGIDEKDNIRMNLRETEWEGMNWMHLAEESDHCQALVNMVVKLRVP
jgi:hypothetical protein